MEIIERRALQSGDEVGLTYLLDGESAAQSWTYRQLWHAVCRVAARLSSADAAGERAILLYEPGLEYVAAFLATMAVGAIAVPAYPPMSKRLAERLRGVVEDCSPALVLTSAAFAGLAPRVPEASAACWIDTEALPAADWTAIDTDPNALAMLQYTSGSTGAPKGVMLSHANISANCAEVHEWLGDDPHRRGCIWLPPYHDMGLLGGILQPLYSGFPLVFMSPLHFVQSPVRWLRAISEHRVTLSGAPNFAYRMCASEIPDAELSGLDLSCWTQAFCGAEPVRPDTMNAFARRFAPFGFAAESVNPCYGLAESTLIVSGKQPGRAPAYATFDRARLEQGVVVEAAGADAVALTGCGRVTGGYDVRIVEPANGAELPPGRLGEIWVAGPSVAQGYWGRPELTQRVFGRTLEGSSARYLDTGDRGFLRDGQLYLAGRSKDMIIIDGKNHYPEDIERTVESTHELLFSGGSVAFAVDVDEQETMVIVAELRKQEGYDEQHTHAVTAGILARVTAVHGVAPRTIVLCRRGAIARTTSGKVRRAASRVLYLSGGLQPIREWSRSELQVGG